MNWKWRRAAWKLRG